MEGIGRFGLSIVAAVAAFVMGKLVLGVVVGTVAASNFGPIYLSDSNLGPLLGLFLTGPAGFVIGGLCGAAIAAGKPG